jgi:acyl-coenzyme A synthetase/AMP-(fatty) acid ligase
MVDKFYKKLYENLNSKNTFYTYYGKNYYYNDLKNYFYKFCNLISFLEHKNNKICVLSEKSFDLYATSLSIILSNNTWVPIPSNSPENRIFEIVNSVKPDLFIIQSLNTLKSLKIKNFLKKRGINTVTFEEINNSQKISNFKPDKFYENNVAMIFFTSGSTGKPKGVKITHKAYIHSLLEQIKNLFGKQKKLIFGDYHDISFVISLNILFPCFYMNGTISPAIEIKDILFPVNHAIDNKINTIITVPTLINKIKNYYKKIPKNFNLKNLILCGEPFFVETLNYLVKKNIATNLYNCYGSTELSPWVFFHKINQKKITFYNKFHLVPVGYPFKKVKIKVMNDILYIGGPTLSIGYIDEDQDKDSFKIISGHRYYRTNDVIEKKFKFFFVKGRSDNVIKIQGHRVELLEIENILRSMKKLTNCYVFIKEISNYDRIICAAIETSNVKISRVETYLKKNLPNYMLPKNMKTFKKFPINRSNKVDKYKIKSSFDD